MEKVVDMWGNELHSGDLIHGIATIASGDIGCPCVCGYRVTDVYSDGTIRVESVTGGNEGRFTKPWRFVSKVSLTKYSPQDLGFPLLAFSTSAYILISSLS